VYDIKGFEMNVAGHAITNETALTTAYTNEF
jgi:hypothetical protein